MIGGWQLGNYIDGCQAEYVRVPYARANLAPVPDELSDEQYPFEAVRRLTGGRGVDAAIEALGTQGTFESCVKATRPGGHVSSLSVYGGKLELPLEAYVYGIGDKQILSTLCPGGKGRMRKLMELVRGGAWSWNRSLPTVSGWTRSKRRTIFSGISATR